MTEKMFMIKFTLTANNIQTQVKNTNVTPQEAIGLLEMAKDQVLTNIRKGRKEIFHATDKGE